MTFKPGFYAIVQPAKGGFVAEVRKFKLFGFANEADAWATIRLYADELLKAATSMEKKAISDTTGDTE